MRLIFAGLIATLGCSGVAGDDGIDPVDAGGDSDGGDPGITTLVVELESNPEIPGSLVSAYSATLTSASITISDYRVVGDAATSDNTRIAELLLTWESEDEVVRFEDIPVGRYTLTRGRVVAYRLGGTCVINDETFTWEIDDTLTTGIDFTSDFDAVDLSGGQTAFVELDIDLERLFNAVAWDQVTPDGDLLRIDSSSPEIEAVRGSIRAAFEEDVDDS